MWTFKRKNIEENQLDASQENLLTSLASFLELYSQRQDCLIQTSDILRQLTAQIREKKEEDKQSKMTQALLGAFAGAALGATFGVLVGGASGAFGSIGVAACDGFCTDINGVGLGVGFVGGVLGGAVGGTFSGALGGAIGSAAEAAGHSIQCDVYDLAWVVIGSATGGAIGNIFGGAIGAGGGVIGGGMGGFCGLSVAVGVMRNLNYNIKEIRKTQQSETQRGKIPAVEVLQKTGQDFRETIKLLLEALDKIQTISKKMDSRVRVGGVAGQSTKTITALATMEKVFRKMQTTEDEAKMMSWIEEMAQKSTPIMEELEKMKAEVEKLLDSLKEC